MNQLFVFCLLVFVTGCSEYSNQHTNGSPKQQVLLKKISSADLAKAPLMHGWNSSQTQKLQLKVAAELGLDKGISFQDVIHIDGDNVFGPKMIITPPGAFVMGCYDGDVSCFPRNNIKIIVIIDYPLAVAESELTVADWNICVEAGYCKAKLEGVSLPMNEPSTKHVTNVSWSDAQSYVSWLSMVTKRKYRLLSESEHEYISRAGGTGYRLGNLLNCKSEKYQGIRSDECFFNPNERGKESLSNEVYTANAWGFKLIHSNKWEWVQDCYHQSIDKYTPRDGSSYPIKGACKSKLYIGRGGSMGGIYRILRNSNRHIGRRNEPHADFSIRIAREIN
jgi:formylglycine-generating enzyme required for sulfatase activity